MAFSIFCSEIVFISILGLFKRSSYPNTWAASWRCLLYQCATLSIFFNFIPQGYMVSLFYPYMVSHTWLYYFPSYPYFLMFLLSYFQTNDISLFVCWGGLITVEYPLVHDVEQRLGPRKENTKHGLEVRKIYK